MLGLDKRLETSWKNDFSYNKINVYEYILGIVNKWVYVNTHRQRHRWLCIQHQHKNVRIQAVIVDPVVQIRRHVHTGRVDKHYVVAQQAALFPWPEYPNLGALAQLIDAQSVRQLLHILRLQTKYGQGRLTDHRQRQCKSLKILVKV